MKFKLIFAMFNGIIVISFLFVFLMPLFVLGLEYTAGFWAQNWYLVFIFIMILALLDFYFFINWKTFSLLEQENWTELSSYLEHKIFTKKNFGDQTIGLLCNAWVVQGKPLEILRLEALIREAKPSLLPRYGVLLGIPHLLKNDSADMETFFRPFIGTRGLNDSEWMRFNLAFCLLTAHKIEEAIPILGTLALQKKERIVQLLSLYLLESQEKIEAVDSSAQLAAAEEFRSHFTAPVFAQFVGRFRENLQVIILSKFIQEASVWIFSGPKPEGKTNE